MANPELYDLSEAAAEGLSAVVDDGSGIKHQDFDADENSSPSSFAQLMNLERKLMLLLASGNRGQVVWSGSGLSVGAFALEYELTGTAYSFAGDAAYGLSLPVSDTSYVYLDSAATLKSQITSWPSGDHIKLAKVVTDGSAVTAVTDMRLANLQVGINNAWWTVNPTAAVNFNGQDADNIAGLGLADPVTLTLDAAGDLVLDGVQTNIRVDTFGAAAGDFIESITTSASMKGRLVFLRAEDAARTVTLQASAITTPNGDFVMDDVDKFIVLFGDDAGGFAELFRNDQPLTQLYADLNVNQKALLSVGLFNLYAPTVTIASGQITASYSLQKVATESDAPTDDLDAILYGEDGDLLWLVPADSAKVVTVKDGANIALSYGDFVMNRTTSAILLRFDAALAKRVELFRSHIDIADLAKNTPPKALPYDWTVELTGALTVAVAKYKMRCQKAFTLSKVSGYLGTAPSGGACIIDILINGLSIFSSQAEMINIADGTTFDESATKNAAVAVGDYIEIEVEVATGSPADATISFDGYIAPHTPPS